jgi:nucleotide-binding universal stress UspA family protein
MLRAPKLRSQDDMLRRRPKVSFGYTRVVVPLTHDPASEKALDLACRLAAERHALLAAIVVIEIPALLPLDAHMLEEEDNAYRLLDQAEAVADSYGVSVSPRVLRARDAAGAIAEHARSLDADLIIIGGSRNRGRTPNAPLFDAGVYDLLKKARVVSWSSPESTKCPGDRRWKHRRLSGLTPFQ